MLALNYTQSLLNLQEVIVKKVITTKESTVIDIEMPKKPHICPCCSCLTSFVHDYRYQPVKDIPAFGAKIILNYRKRRYVCPHCGKRFSESHPFVPKYHRMTSRLVAYIFEAICQLLGCKSSHMLKLSDLICEYCYIGTHEATYSSSRDVEMWVSRRLIHISISF